MKTAKPKAKKKVVRQNRPKAKKVPLGHAVWESVELEEVNPLLLRQPAIFKFSF